MVEARGFSHKYMLARLHRGLRHGEVEFVGSTDVDGVEFGIGEQLLIVAGGPLDALGVGELPCCPGSPSSNTGHFYIAEAAECFRMHSAHETDSKDGDLELLHIL